MRGKIVSTNEIISAVMCIEEAHNYLKSLPYHTLLIYETLGIHGFEKSNQLIVTILKQYDLIRSKMKTIENLDICPEFNDSASTIWHDANKNMDYLLDTFNKIKHEKV